MTGAAEPWQRPAGGYADGGGVTGKRRLGKPLETMGRKARDYGAGFRAMSVRLHGKLRETVRRKTRG